MTDKDVVIIGGGPAGLNAGLMLGRARRSVLVVDAGQPRNAPAEHMHGFLSRDGMPPAELLAIGRTEVEGYGGEVSDGRIDAGEKTDDGFAVRVDDRTVTARRILLATGLTDQLPDIPGVAQRWGRKVVHCPYCHGWEIRDRPIGVLNIGPMSVHQTLMFRQWTSDLTLFVHNGPEPSGDERRQLDARGITVVTGVVRAVEDDGVRLADGTLVPVDAVAVGAPMVANAGFLETLGLKAVDHPSGMAQHVVTDAMGRTDVPGIWAAGNVTDPMAQVISAAAAGALAAAAINADLIAEETRLAVENAGRQSRQA